MNAQSSHYLKFSEMFDGLKLRDDLWIEWQHKMVNGVLCGEICKALNECWFREDNRPPQPLHGKCHCIKRTIKNPVPNKTARAVCDLTKFTEYIFNKEKSKGKFDLFVKLGFSMEDARYLQYEYERQAVEKYCKGEYSLHSLSEYGQSINITIEFEKNGRHIEFISGWMVRPYGTITNNTPLGDK